MTPEEKWNQIKDIAETEDGCNLCPDYGEHGECTYNGDCPFLHVYAVIERR